MKVSLRSVNLEGNFWNSQFFQKTKEKNYPESSLDNFSFRFLEELRIPEVAFEIY